MTAAERELVNQFYDLFDGNRMAVGTEQGGCLRLSDPQYDWVNHVYMHLADGGENAIGVYPMRPWFEDKNYDHYLAGWKVKWGCVDFDDGEDVSYGHARNLQQMLAKFGITGWIERSRSKGFHVWVFADKWEPARVMRRGLLMACTLVGAPTREINPKAEGSDDPNFLGNYVRLPYPGHLGKDNVVSFRHRLVLEDENSPINVESFVHQATERRGIQGLYKLAEAYKPPAPVVHHEVRQIDSTEVDEALGRCRGLTKLFIDEGPRDRGRSEWLFILGNQLVKDGLHTIDEMVALLAFADAQHGEKFTHRRDAELRYSEIIDKALVEL